MSVENFTTPGSSTWTCPANVFYVQIECWGGGGGGQGHISGGNTGGGAGGGGGEYAIETLFLSTPSTVYDYVVAAGGAGGATDTNGSNGEASSFNTTTCVANGGSGGTAGGGAGGTGGTGDTLYAGGAGADVSGDLGGSGGGSSGGNASVGNVGSLGNSVGGAGGTAPTDGGDGGAGGDDTLDGVAGTQPGGGGGGGGNGSSNGGNGAVGKIRLTYTAGLISLDNTDVDEHQAAGTLVGNLSAVGGVPTYTYSLSAGVLDNDFFQIDGATLETAVEFTQETQATYDVRITCTDSNGKVFTTDFTITINDVQDPPSDIALSNATFKEYWGTAQRIGDISGTDPEMDSLVFSLPAGVQDNDLFQIDGTELQTKNSIFDWSSQSSYNVTIRATDTSGEYRQESFALTVKYILSSGKSPDAISGLIAWWKAWDGLFQDAGGTTAVISNDDVVHRRNDSFNNYNMTDTSSEPTYSALNNYAKTVYNGQYNEHPGASPNLGSDDSFSGFILIRLTSDPSSTGVIFSIGYASEDSWLLKVDSSRKILFVFNQFGVGTITLSTPALSLNTNYSVVFKYNGTGSGGIKIFINSVLQTLSVDEDNITAETVSSRSFVIGNVVTPSNNGLVFTASEAGFYNTEISDIDAVELSKYLMNVTGQCTRTNESTLIWNKRQLCSPETILIWNQLTTTNTTVNNDCTLIWSCRQLCSPVSTLKWNEYQLSPLESILIWNERQLCGPETNQIWNKRQLCGPDSSLIWNSQQLCSPETIQLWQERQLLNRESIQLWDKRQLTNIESSQNWNEYQLVNIESILKWSSRALCNLESVQKWSSRQVCSPESILKWAKYQAVNTETIEKWGKYSLINLESILKWSERQLASSESIQKWNSRQLCGPVSTLNWGSYNTINSSTLIKWASRQLSGLESIEKWSIRQVASPQTIIPWNIRQYSTSESILKWSEYNLTSNSSILPWSVYSSVSNTSILQWMVEDGITLYEIYELNLIAQLILELNLRGTIEYEL